MANLHRLRWGVRAVLALGVAASVTANILHAQPNPISQTIAAWPPIALLLTVELISRVPVHRRGLAFARFASTAVIAGIAAWVSYWHMAGVAARYGETGAAPYLLPLSVDGLVVVASVCLVELAGRIAATERTVQDSAAKVELADGGFKEPQPSPRPVRPHTPSVRNGRRPATLEDARRIAGGRLHTITRDELAAGLRADGLAAANGRAGELLRDLRASVRELVPA